MAKGLAITRSLANQEIIFLVKDSNNEVITIKQSLTGIVGNQVKLVIDAPMEVAIIRGEHYSDGTTAETELRKPDHHSWFERIREGEDTPQE